MKEKYENHLKEKEMSRLEKEKDKKQAQSTPSATVAVYDLQASLPSSKDNISTLFSKIFNAKTKECFF